MAADHEHDLDWNDALQDWLDGELDPAGAAALEAHLTGCPICQARAQELGELDRALHTALPPIALDATFDERLSAQINAIDESQRAEARRRLEQELERNLHALSRGWRRTLGLIVPGIVAGIALAFALAAWLDDSGLVHRLVVESAGQLGRDTSDLVQLSLITLLGAGIGLGIARWLASVTQ